MRWVRVIVAVLLAAYGAFGIPSLPSLPVQAEAEVSVQEPSSQMKALVRPLVRVVSRMNPLDRLWLQYIYSNAAKVVSADGLVEPKVIVTTEGLRAVHVAILKFIWRGMAENTPGEYDGLKESIETIFNDTIGDTQRALTADLRAKAVEMFEAISWAGLGKDE